MKNIYTNFLRFSLLFCGLLYFNAYSQQKMVCDVSFESIGQANPKYLKNFNPIDYDRGIMKECIIDLINHARKTCNVADPLIRKDLLDTAAKFQSDFMAKKQERTYENVVSYLKTTDLRAVKAGATKRVSELVTRAKATKDNAKSDYSYLEVATEVVNYLLKSNKTANIPLDKKFTYIGVGLSVDEYYKNVYVSLVFGNDLSFNKDDITYKNTTYTRKLYGLKPYNEKACRKCEVKGIEDLQKSIVLKGNDIYFVHPNLKQLKKIIGRKKDGIAVDIVQHSQYLCNSQNDIDLNFPNRGVMLKYMKYKKLVKKNEITDKKDKGVYTYLGTVPNNVNTPYDINLILIKNKFVCRTLVKTNIHPISTNYSGKTSLIPDLTGIQTSINYIPEPEKTRLEFNIPFELNKSDYQPEDIEPFIAALKEPRFIIDSLNIVASTSFEGSDQSNEALQKRRSESIINAMKKMQVENISYNIHLEDGYELLISDLKNSKEFVELANLSRNDLKAKLSNTKMLKNLEPILKNHRRANIVMNATYDISEKYEQGFVVNKFNKTLAKGDLPMAFAIQKYIIKRVEDGVYKKDLIDSMVIPFKASMLPFLTNKYYMLSMFGGLSEDNMKTVINMAKFDNKNQIAEFNALCCAVLDMEISSNAQVIPMQVKIDKFYNTPIGKNYQTKVDALNMTFQYKVLDYINGSDIPDEALMDIIYNKIKEIALPTITNWQKAYEVASTFIDYADYEFARQTMDPFINDPKVSEDYIFTYMNLYSIDERTYTSKKFETACKLASQKNRTRFCNEIKTYTYLIRENIGVKNIICSECK